jgi:hypothetical protein
MYHCHNLVHEDNDMMLVFQVGVLLINPIPYTLYLVIENKHEALDRRRVPTRGIHSSTFQLIPSHFGN